MKNPTPISAAPASSGGRAGPSNGQPAGQRLRARAQALIGAARSRLGRLTALPYARVVLIFVAGFAAGMIFDAYNGAARRAIAGTSPLLTWMAPTPSSERLKTMEVALATARQSLNKLASEMSRLEVQHADAPAPRRRSGN
jgi:hypothetical protein